MKNELWPRITKKNTYFKSFIFSPNDRWTSCQQNRQGIPSFLFCWFLGIFLPRALVVLGGFDPLAPLEGDPEFYQIFYSNLDDLWWSPFVAS